MLFTHVFDKSLISNNGWQIQIHLLQNKNLCFNLFYIFFLRILLSFGAQKCKDKRGYTPLFYASSAGSSANLIELIDTNSDVNYKATDGKTPMSKANTSSTVKLLASYGAETTNYVEKDQKSDFSKFIDTHFETTPRFLLDQCISEVEEELLVLDFSHFQQTTEEKNEMDLHLQLSGELF